MRLRKNRKPLQKQVDMMRQNLGYAVVDQAALRERLDALAGTLGYEWVPVKHNVEHGHYAMKPSVTVDEVRSAE